MSNETAVEANEELRPDSKGSRYTKPLPILSRDDWNDIHDALLLAMDALGDGPDSTDRDFAWCNLGYARSKLKRASRRAEKAKARRLA